MHSLDTAGTTNLETHFGCSVLFLPPLLVGICHLFDGMNVLEERQRTNIREDAFLLSITWGCEDPRLLIVCA
jgi:hypothetical protein